MRFEFDWVLACLRQWRRILIISILAGLSCFSTGATASENHTIWDALRSGGICSWRLQYTAQPVGSGPSSGKTHRRAFSGARHR
jgi:hypothetical protein